MSSYSSQLEHLIEELGGCGLAQKLLCTIIHSASTIAYWSVLAMAFIGYDPGFSCHKMNVKIDSLDSINLSETSTYRLCSLGPNAICSAYVFPHNINTVVTEWNLVCDRRWIVAFITSIQMVGVVIGSIGGGQMADSMGRKPTLFASVITMVLFNFAGYFTQSWQAYSAIRFFLGVGVGLWFTVQFPQMMEFVPSQMRSFVPESFRWLVSKKKFVQAERSISFVAYVNGVPKPDLEEIFDTAATEINTPSNNTTEYTVAIFWKSKELRSITMRLSVLWFAICTSWYGMSLGMESISVNIYLTIFLISLVDVPAVSFTGLLVNRFGRKKYCFVVSGVSGILSCVSGMLQYFEKLPRSSVSLTLATLVISLISKMAVTSALIALIIYTTELYPTVVRANGFGFQSTVGKLGAVACPLLIHLDGSFPGLMYFTCGILLLLSVGGVAGLKETRDEILQDSISNT